MAPIEARTACGGWVRGARAEYDAAGAERERRAQHGADVARIVDAPERDADRPGARAPSAGV